MVRSPYTCISASTFSCEPRPTASITITEATPMMMPSSVRAVRSRLICITCSADRKISARSAHRGRRSRVMSGAGVVVLVRKSCPSAGRPATRSSPTIRPSAIEITRCARAATAASCVISTTVCPAACSASSSSITCAPLAESSAPVGSSARITRPPLTSARAIDTRCCWPPDSCRGRCCSRSPSPSRESRVAARVCRARSATPA